MAKLSENAIRQALTNLPGWELTEEGLRKKYEFTGFPEAVRFVEGHIDSGHLPMSSDEHRLAAPE